MSAEQSKAESAQRALEEQRKVMVQQIAMEREELERAKVSPATPCSAALSALTPKDAHSVSSCPRPRVPCWRSRSPSCTSVERSGDAWQPSGLSSLLSRS